MVLIFFAERMIVIICMLLDAVFLSITHFGRLVESHLPMGSVGDLRHQFQLGPSKPPDGPDVPRFLLDCQLRFQDNCVLRPTDGHSLRQYLWVIFVGMAKVPHPAQVPG